MTENNFKRIKEIVKEMESLQASKKVLNEPNVYAQLSAISGANVVTYPLPNGIKETVEYWIVKRDRELTVELAGITAEEYENLPEENSEEPDLNEIDDNNNMSD